MKVLVGRVSPRDGRRYLMRVNNEFFGKLCAGVGKGWRHCWSPKWNVREVATADSPVLTVPSACPQTF
jgi:hypothetical protein